MRTPWEFYKNFNSGISKFNLIVPTGRIGGYKKVSTLNLHFLYSLNGFSLHSRPGQIMNNNRNPV